MDTNKFVNRHVGISAEDIPSMLQAIGVKSVDELIDQTIPSNIRLKEPLNLPEPMTEREFAEHISELASKTKSSLLISEWVGMTQYVRLLSNVTYLKIRFGTLPTLRTRQKFHKDVWKLC